MENVNLEQFGYSKEIAEEFSKRTIGKVVMSTMFRQRKLYQSRIEKLMAGIEGQMGIDWFDFAFMEKQNNSIVVTFMKGKRSNQRFSKISFIDTCLLEGRFDEVMKMVDGAKRIIDGN